MAVPSSGALTILGVARELVNDDYTDTTAITSPISLKDMAVSGNSNGSGVSFDDVNVNFKTGTGTVTTAAETNVAINQFRMNGSISSYGTGGGIGVGVPYRLSDFYSYDHDNAYVLEKGFVYSSSQSTPTISNATKRVVSGTGTGSYSYLQNTGVLANTTYYYRAINTNADGKTYGKVETLTTPAGQTLHAVSLQYVAGHSGGDTVCDSSNMVTVYSTQSTAANIFIHEPDLFSNSSGTSYASAGWYSNGSKKGRWGLTGSVVSGTVTDCADE